MNTEAPQKPIHSLILDTGPLIQNAVSISTLINSAEEIFTTPAIISEIRDEATRSRVQTTLMPFLKVRTPRPVSYDAVIAFSKKTGDHSVLSRQDLGILALAYEIHCERNDGPWGLREAPKQPVKVKPGAEPKPTEKQKKDVASKKEVLPGSEVATEPSGATTEADGEEESWSKPKPRRVHREKEKKRLAREQEANVQGQATPTSGEGQPSKSLAPSEQSIQQDFTTDEQAALDTPDIKEDVPGKEPSQTTGVPEEVTEQTPETHKPDVIHETAEPQIQSQEAQEQTTTEQTIPADSDIAQDLSSLNLTTPPSSPPTSDSDSDGDWITPSNLHTHFAASSGLRPTCDPTTPQKQLDVATMTTDFAMQNVLLQLNLSLLSPSMQRIRHLTSKVLRCHACFLIERDTSKDFCPRCGGASLLRVNCSTNANGTFRLHLKKNFQYNRRGDRYSVPKPVAGSANGKGSGKGGGKGGWGRDLVFSEDQKEYRVQVQGRDRARDVMDEDYLPGIVTGERKGRGGGRVRVGAGRDVNSKRRY